MYFQSEYFSRDKGSDDYDSTGLSMPISKTDDFFDRFQGPSISSEKVKVGLSQSNSHSKLHGIDPRLDLTSTFADFRAPEDVSFEDKSSDVGKNAVASKYNRHSDLYLNKLTVQSSSNSVCIQNPVVVETGFVELKRFVEPEYTPLVFIKDTLTQLSLAVPANDDQINESAFGVSSNLKRQRTSVGAVLTSDAKDLSTEALLANIASVYPSHSAATSSGSNQCPRLDTFVSNASSKAINKIFTSESFVQVMKSLYYMHVNIILTGG
jgi:hypothetical protein